MNNLEGRSDRTGPVPREAPDFAAGPRHLAETPETPAGAGGSPPAGCDGPAATEALHALHELRVHQIELAAQNEELLRAHSELELERARFLHLYDLAPVGYCTLSAEGMIIQCNLAAAALLGSERSALCRRAFIELVRKDHRECYSRQRRQMFRTGRPFECELPMVKADGTLFWARLTAAPEWPGPAGWDQPTPGAHVSTIVLADISERKRQEEEKARVQARNLETLRVLAGGIAHDFNNLLAAIVGNASLGSLKAEPDGEAAPLFLAIESAAMRAAGLTRQLSAYAGTGNAVTAEMDLNITAMEILHSYSASGPAGVRFQCELADRLPFVRADASHILQALDGLVANAIEALAEAGEGLITIRTRAEALDSAALESGFWALAAQPGRYATLEVTDSGPGMAPETMARAIEPFFTTRFLGRGLGLAAVAGILRSHGGGLRVQSLRGHGTTFKVFLPALQGPRSGRCLESLPVWHGEGRLLVVDDDRTARALARRMGENLGLSVIETPGGPGAVELYRHHHGELAAVLLGLGRPRAGARRTFRALRKVDGRVPVILGSWNGVQGLDEHFGGIEGVLTKPYRAAEFQNLVRRTLVKRDMNP